MCNKQYDEAVEVLQNNKVLHHELGITMSQQEIADWTKACRVALAGREAQEMTPKQAPLQAMVVDQGYDEGQYEQEYNEPGLDGSHCDQSYEGQNFQEGV